MWWLLKISISWGCRLISSSTKHHRCCSILTRKFETSRIRKKERVISSQVSKWTKWCRNLDTQGKSNCKSTIIMKIPFTIRFTKTIMKNLHQWKGRWSQLKMKAVLVKYLFSSKIFLNFEQEDPSMLHFSMSYKKKRIQLSMYPLNKIATF